MSEADRAAQIAKWNETMRAHWTRAGRANWSTTARAPTSPPRRTTATSSCWSSTRPCAKADRGIYLRGVPQVQIWDYTEEAKFNLGADKGSGGLWNNSAGRAGQGPARAGRQAVRRVEHVPHRQVGSRVSVWLNDKLVVDHAIMENYYDRASTPCRPGARSSSRRTAARSAGATSSSARSAPRKRTRFSARRADEGFSRHLQRHGLRRLGRPAGQLRGQGRQRSSASLRRAARSTGTRRCTRLRCAAGVQAAARRQQRPGDSLPRRGRHGLRGHDANCRSSTTTTRRSVGRSTRGRRTARRTAWWPRRADTSGRSANGTSRK